MAMIRLSKAIFQIVGMAAISWLVGWVSVELIHPQIEYYYGPKAHDRRIIFYAIIVFIFIIGVHETGRKEREGQ